jgi:hypothetical protein
MTQAPMPEKTRPSFLMTEAITGRVSVLRGKLAGPVTAVRVPEVVQTCL